MRNILNNNVDNVVCNVDNVNEDGSSCGERYCNGNNSVGIVNDVPPNDGHVYNENEDVLDMNYVGMVDIRVS